VVATVPVAATQPAGAPPDPRDPIAHLARLVTRRQVGLALGAGAAKGFAHIGVLRAFDELNVPVDIVSGCSIGSAIAAGRAAGLATEELLEISMRVAARAVRPTLPLHSFLSNAGIRAELEQIARGRRFEDLDLPLAVCATDIYRRCEVTFTTGPLWPRLLASMAIPGIYPPLRAGDSYLVDGSVLNPVPSRQCRDLGAGIVIGVRLTGTRTSPREELDIDVSRPLATETILRCLEIMHNRVSEMSRGDADVAIEVCLDKGGLRDFGLAAEIAEAGYAAAQEAVPELLAAMPYVGANA
jgi:NTE family protein